jgi:hypothetical protein
MKNMNKKNTNSTKKKGIYKSDNEGFLFKNLFELVYVETQA